MVVTPRLGPAGEREPEAPVRFAQLVDLGCGLGCELYLTVQRALPART